MSVVITKERKREETERLRTMSILEFRRWILRHRRQDYEKLKKLVKQYCFPWVKNELDLYYCLSDLYKKDEAKDIFIPLHWELAVILYYDILIEN